MGIRTRIASVAGILILVGAGVTTHIPDQCELTPEFATKVSSILRELEAMGWQPTVASMCRHMSEQREKVRKGYSKTLNSRHLTGHAVDVVDKRWGWSGPASNLNFKFWKDYGKLCVKYGLEWGGNWKRFKDVAHCQVPRNRR